MENRSSSGALLISGLVAAGAIGIALIANHFSQSEPLKGPGEIVTQDSGREENLMQEAYDWRNSLADLYPQRESSAGYIAPSALPTSEALGRELFVSYLNLRDQGEISDEALDEVVRELIGRNTPTGEPTQYAFTDLVAGSEDTAVGNAAYEAGVAEALKKGNAITQYELSSFYAYLESGNTAHINTLKFSLSVYESVLEDLLALPVPPSRMSVHLELVNSLSDVIHVLTLMSTKYDDPYTMLIAIDKFVAAEKRFAEAYALFTNSPLS